MQSITNTPPIPAILDFGFSLPGGPQNCGHGSALGTRLCQLTGLSRPQLQALLMSIQTKLECVTADHFDLSEAA